MERGPQNVDGSYAEKLQSIGFKTSANKYAATAGGCSNGGSDDQTQKYACGKFYAYSTFNKDLCAIGGSDDQNAIAYAEAVTPSQVPNKGGNDTPGAFGKACMDYAFTMHNGVLE